MNATEGESSVADVMNARAAELSALRDQRRSLEATTAEASKDMAGNVPMMIAIILGIVAAIAFFAGTPFFGLLFLAPAIVLLAVALRMDSRDPKVREARDQILQLPKVKQRISELEEQQQATLKANLDVLELQKTCARCGTIWHVSPRTVRNLQGQNATTLLIGLVGGDYAQTAGNQQKASEALRSLQTCPKCSSGKHEETWVD